MEIVELLNNGIILDAAVSSFIERSSSFLEVKMYYKVLGQPIFSLFGGFLY